MNEWTFDCVPARLWVCMYPLPIVESPGKQDVVILGGIVEGMHMMVQVAALVHGKAFPLPLLPKSINSSEVDYATGSKMLPANE